MPRLYNSSSSSNNSASSASNNNNNRYTPYQASQSNTRSTWKASSSSTSSNWPSFNIRYNSSGYRQFNTSNNSNSGSGGWQFTHRRVAEKSIGREIKPTEHVHHINRIKTDNRRNNLAVLDQSIHQHLHSTRNETTACFRCGNTSHYASNCYARTDVFGRSVVGSGTRTSYYDNDSSDDSDDSDCSGGGGCSRCGRTSHSASSCYARTDVYGNGL